MSVTRFNFYKISVERTQNISLFTDVRPKHQVVKDAFDVGEPITFMHRKILHAFVKHRVVGDYIIGSLGRQSETELSGPPSTGFEATVQEEWPHVLAIINTSDQQPFGQTIAIERDDTVFRSQISQLRALVEEMSATSSTLEGYELILNSVTTQESFWEIVRSRTGRIQKLTFDLAVPNFLGLNNVLSESLRQIKDDFNATNATVSIQNPEGNLSIPHSSTFVGEAVEYASAGAGDIKLQVANEGTVDAKRNKVTARIETVDTHVVVETENVETVKRICDTLFSCLED
jgi:hypothetical protein